MKKIFYVLVLISTIGCATRPKSGFVDFTNSKALREVSKISSAMTHSCTDTLHLTFREKYYCLTTRAVDEVYKSFSVSVEDDRKIAKTLKKIRKAKGTPILQIAILQLDCMDVLNKELERDMKFEKEQTEKLKKNSL